MRVGTAFLLTFVLLCGAAIGADVWVTAAAEERASDEATARLGAPAQVSMRGWPVTIHLLRGQVPELELVAAGVPIDGTDQRIDRLQVVLTDARVEFRGLRTPPQLEAGAGQFHAELSEAAVGGLVGLPGAVTMGDGLGAVLVAGQTIEMTATAEAGAVVFRPLVPSSAPGVQPVELRLPDLPGASIEVERVLVAPGALRLSGSVVLREL